MKEFEYALLVLHDELSDQRQLRRQVNEEEEWKKIEERIESLKKAIKILKEVEK